MRSSSPFNAVLALLFAIDSPITLRAVAQQCYGINGQKSSGTPCNSDASQGTHSACCDESKQEACLSTGLCYAALRGDNNTFWSEGCTDTMGRDPACPLYCGTTSMFISMPLQPSYTMLFCGAGSWCCCFDNLGMSCDKTECCARAFTLDGGLGTVVRQLDNTGGSTIGSNSSDSDWDLGFQSEEGSQRGSSIWDWQDMRSLIPVIMAGLAGSLLLATVVALALTCTQNRRLRRQVETLQLLSAKSSSFSSVRSARPSVSSQQQSPPPPLASPYPPANEDSLMISSSSDVLPIQHQQQSTSLRTPSSSSSIFHHHGTMHHYPQSLTTPVSPNPGFGGGSGPTTAGYGFPMSMPMPMPSGSKPSLPSGGGGAVLRYLNDSGSPDQELRPGRNDRIMRGPGNAASAGVISELPTEKDYR